MTKEEVKRMLNENQICQALMVAPLYKYIYAAE